MIQIIVLFLLGLLMLLKPELLWKIKHIFTVKQGEPSDLYIALLRIGGFFAVLSSILIAIFFIF